MNYSKLSSSGGWIKKTFSLRWAVFLGWTVLIGLSLLWNMVLHQQTIQEQARIIAGTAFDKDVLYRRWNSQHGGVYVWVTETTQPNPYLADRAKRDQVTVGGEMLTLINPAYMTRQVFELQRVDMGVIGHITSLKPIRPENTADAWEVAALQSFEQGATESSGIVLIDQQPVLRLMRPLMVEKSCLTCHATQGYQVGEVRGGISESVKLGPLQAAGEDARNLLIFAHLGIWGIGLAGGLAGSVVLRRSQLRQQVLEQKMIEMSTHDRLSGLFNRNYFEETLTQMALMKEKPLSIIMADVDGLKQTNDEYGHAAGDELIRRVAEVFRTCFREQDMVARIGGDEFVVLIPNCDEARAVQVMQRVEDSLKQHNLHYPHRPLQISLGMTTSLAGETIHNTLKRADQRMYEQKRRKKAQPQPV